MKMLSKEYNAMQVVSDYSFFFQPWNFAIFSWAYPAVQFHSDLGFHLSYQTQHLCEVMDIGIKSNHEPPDRTHTKTQTHPALTDA